MLAHKFFIELGAVLYLDSKQEIGRGSHRVCYQHPENESRCIKIEYNRNTNAGIREKKYYLHLKRRNYSWELVARYYGSTNTNQGPGEIFELIRDDDGSVSNTLDIYLRQSYGPSISHLVEAFFEFKDKLFDHAIITSKLSPENIAVKKSCDRYVLILIDDIGNTEFFPVSSHSRYFAAKKIRRKWRRFEEHLTREFPNSVLMRQLKLGEIVLTSLDEPKRAKPTNFYQEVLKYAKLKARGFLYHRCNRQALRTDDHRE